MKKRGLNIIMNDKKPNKSIHNETSFSKKSRFALMDFNENPNVGVFCRTNDDIVFIRKSLTKKVKCEHCHGAGWVWWKELKNYPYPDLNNGEMIQDDNRYTCDWCNGTGKLDDKI